VWVALLGLGTWGLARAAVPGRVRRVLGVSLGAFAVLHVFYSEETFLFMTLYGPLLVLLGALATRTPARAVALVLAGLLVAGGALTNARQHKRAGRLLRQESVLIPQGWWGPRVGGASPSAPSPSAGGEPRPAHGGQP
jgi:hypothetical protein